MGASVFDVESPEYVAIRWLHYSALLVLVGVVTFALMVLPLLRRVAGPDLLPDLRIQTARLGQWSVLLVAVTALMRFVAQSLAMHGERSLPDPAMIAALLRVTQWGRAWVLEMFAVVVAFLALRRAANNNGKPWAVAAAAVLAMAISQGMSGHAAASDTFATAAVVADTLHIIGAGGWLGGLLLVVLLGVPAALSMAETQRWPAMAALVNAFSPTALVFASITAVTGLFAAWLHIESFPALWQTRYGQVLLLKLGVLSVTAGIGCYNWQRVKPMLGSGPDGTRRLQRSAAAELGIGILVILITAVLVATPTGMDM